MVSPKRRSSRKLRSRSRQRQRTRKTSKPKRRQSAQKASPRQPRRHQRGGSSNEVENLKMELEDLKRDFIDFKVNVANKIATLKYQLEVLQRVNEKKPAETKGKKFKLF